MSVQDRGRCCRAKDEPNRCVLAAAVQSALAQTVSPPPPRSPVLAVSNVRKGVEWRLKFYGSPTISGDLSKDGMEFHHRPHHRHQQHHAHRTCPRPEPGAPRFNVRACAPVRPVSVRSVCIMPGTFHDQLRARRVLRRQI